MYETEIFRLITAAGLLGGVSQAQPDIPLREPQTFSIHNPAFGNYIDIYENDYRLLLKEPYFKDGVYTEANGIDFKGFSAEVFQQPKDNPNFVADGKYFTQFSSTKDGVIGLLTEAGDLGPEVKKLKAGDTFNITMNNGKSETFNVDGIYSYEVIDPYNPYSPFVDTSGSQIAMETIFNKFYTRDTDENIPKDKVVLQTCILNPQGTPIGRYFVVSYSEHISQNVYFRERH